MICRQRAANIDYWIYKQFSMGIDLLPPFIRQAYEVHEWKHACAILKHDFPNE